MSALRYRQSAFTLIELLIVIVVIAILAAVSIVAYNGIQSRARSSEASAALAQAKKKLELYKVNAGNYPPTGSLADAGVTNGSVGYQYTSDGTTYCITGTAGNVSYRASHTTSPAPGGCAGHGQGGVAAITNFAVDPSFEGGLLVSTHSNVSRANLVVGDAFSGSRITRVTRNDATQSGIWWNAVNVPTPSTEYTVCLYLRGTDTTTRLLSIEWINTAGNSIVSRSHLNNISTIGSSWSRHCGTATSPSTDVGRLRITLYATGGTAGTYFDVDGVMVTTGSTEYNYADGNSTNWTWNGTPHNSSSTGPPL